jgi:Shedu protein SduA, N-terminal
MGNDHIIRMVSTSASSADVSDVVLRETSRRRLVFRATLVRNPQNAEASVRGLLVYQAKRDRDGWVDVDSLKLTNLKAGEWTKVELSSEEILRLYQAVASLYSYMRERGISYGEQELVPITKGEVVRRVLALLDGDDTQELVETFLDWASNQDTRTLATSLGATNADSLITFGAAVTAARMRRFIDVARRGLTISEESKWQSLLKHRKYRRKRNRLPFCKQPNRQRPPS